MTKTTFKNTNFAPPPENCAQQISKKKPIFIGSKKGGQVIDLEVAKLLTLKWPTCGQVVDPTAHIYIYIYAVELITWPFFAKSRVNNLAMVELITWPSFFEPIKIGVFGDFLVHSYGGVVLN